VERPGLLLVGSLGSVTPVGTQNAEEDARSQLAGEVVGLNPRVGVLFIDKGDPSG
jgi:hypothetical protein